MVPALSVEQFLQAPIGKTFAGRRYVVWCWSERLCGSCHWGQLDRADVDDMLRFIEWRATEFGLIRGFDMVNDCARIEGIEPEAYAFVAEKWGLALPKLKPIVRRLGFVRGSGFLGSVMAGMLPLAYGEASYAAFEDARAAFDWIENPDAAAAWPEVCALIAHHIGVPPTLESLRRHLRTSSGATTLEATARMLGRSPRSLQRDLRESGVSFQAELSHARIETARALLDDPSRKIESIAHQIGFASLAQFSRLFRRQVGISPSEYRTRPRGN